MLERAEKRLRNSISEKERNKIHLSLGNSRNIPFKRNFDVIFSSLSFHHWKQREASIPYILRRLNVGGNFLIYEFNRERVSFLRRKLSSSHCLSAHEMKDVNFEGYERKIQFHAQYIKVVFTSLVER